jgi:hypothetical protein
MFVAFEIELESIEVLKYFDFCNGKLLKIYHIGFILLYLEDVR